jgi:hypothetical protein
VLVAGGEFFPGLERFLAGPAPSGDPDEGGQWDGSGGVGAVERQFARAPVYRPHRLRPMSSQCLPGRSRSQVWISAQS